MTLVEVSDCVLVSNDSGARAHLRVNGPVAADEWDVELCDGEWAWIRGVVVETVHVYVDATSGVRVVAW